MSKVMGSSKLMVDWRIVARSNGPRTSRHSEVLAFGDIGHCYSLFAFSGLCSYTRVECFMLLASGIALDPFGMSIRPIHKIGKKNFFGDFYEAKTVFHIHPQIGN